MYLQIYRISIHDIIVNACINININEVGRLLQQRSLLLQSCVASCTSLSCRRQTRAMHCITPIALYTKLDSECNKQATTIGLLLTTLGDGGHAVAASRRLRCTQRWTVSAIH